MLEDHMPLAFYIYANKFPILYLDYVSLRCNLKGFKHSRVIFGITEKYALES